MRKLYALLEYVTQDNWHDVIDAFKRQTTSEARINTNELHLVMERVGEVAGADAIAEALSSTNPAEKNRVGEILAGWAESDPKASLAWFQGQQPEMQKQFLQLFLDGVSQSDPRQALSLVMSQPQDVQEKIIPIIVENAVQHGGFREAEALLSPLIGRADIDDGTRGKVFSKLAHRRIAVGAVTGDPFEALNWFANYFGPQSPAGPMATTAIVWNAAVKDPNATLHWLEERSVQRGSSAGGIAYPIVAQALVQQSPEQFNAWMNAHADHPQHDSMVEAATGIFLRKGKLEEAGQWAATVSSPEIRAKIDAAIQKASSRPQTAKPADLK